MALNLLQDLGLSLNEARVYEALITYGGSGVSTISLRSKVHRRNTYDAVHRLIEKGLVYEVFEQRETIYEAVDPGKLMEFVKDKERMLSAELPHLLSIYRSHRAPQRAYIYKGIEGFKNYLRAALKCGEDMYFVGAKGGWFDPRIEPFTDWFLKEAKKKSMRYFHIFDAAVEKDLEKVPHLLGGPYKFLPKKYSTTSALDIFGDHIVTFTGLGLAKLEDDVTVYVLVSPKLAESYRTWWKLIWDLLPEQKRRSKK